MKQQPNKVIKGIKIGLSVIFYIIIAVLLVFSLATITKRKVNDIPNIFGFGFLAVDEDAVSMQGDKKESFDPGSLVFVKVLNAKDKEKLDMQKLADDGVVISFFDPYLEIINTHRVIRYENHPVLGESVVTQGDNPNNEEDPFNLHRGDILAIYRGHVGGVGKAIGFMQTQLGFALVVMVPMLLILFWQGYVLIKNIYVAKTETLKATLEKEKEEERQRIKQELLEEMKNDNNNEEKE